MRENRRKRGWKEELGKEEKAATNKHWLTSEKRREMGRRWFRGRRGWKDGEQPCMNVWNGELGMAASSTLVNSQAQHQHSLTVLSAFGGRRTDDGRRRQKHNKNQWYALKKGKIIERKAA
jgi:hypothetical protein